MKKNQKESGTDRGGDKKDRSYYSLKRKGEKEKQRRPKVQEENIREYPIYKIITEGADR